MPIPASETFIHRGVAVDLLADPESCRADRSVYVGFPDWGVAAPFGVAGLDRARKLAEEIVAAVLDRGEEPSSAAARGARSVSYSRPAPAAAPAL